MSRYSFSLLTPTLNISDSELVMIAQTCAEGSLLHLEILSAIADYIFIIHLNNFLIYSYYSIILLLSKNIDIL